MSKYVFGCTVKAVTRNNTTWKVEVVPMANYCVRRKADDSDKTYAAILPVDDKSAGFAVQYDKVLGVNLSKCRMLCWNGTFEIELEDSTTASSSMGEIEFEQVKDSSDKPRRFSITKLMVK